ncbi:hypothetical protein B0H16DRAFT_135592 [Mycena metata]|uniref:Novel STAND NTPase 1 domain-containing protein n=1 Tax=Mycena metata TaxID=1033252 RepID=A0AAD7I4P6_9AGAR|nr:hypothetical protein B0H16DRAFT_135592 [Mycena metata]
MPHQDPAIEARIHNLTAYLTPAITLLEELNDAFGPPCIQPIVKTVQALVTGVQKVKRNKDDCFQLVESIHQVLYPIIHLHLKSETAGSLPPSVLDKVADFTDTLHKIYTFLEIQQDGNKIRQFFRQSEVNKLLKDCHTGLNQANETFQVQTGLTVLDNVIQIQREAETMHKDLIELITTLSDGTTSDRSSSVFYKKANGSQLSSNSFSLLPSKPKIFHGRDSELKQIIEVLSKDAPRIAILGGGGMGKTSLARAALHHTDTCTKFEHRFFVSAEAATTAIELAALIGLHLGLEPGKDLTKPVVRYFARQTRLCLLILDNLETPWEPIQSRAGVENFLSLLADVERLALIITMRGSERPGQVLWTPPFLYPLQPLSDEASEQVFEEITDDSHASTERTQLLAFTENMPLAVDLMAHLVDHEGIENVLTRWKAEKTAALSTGYDRTSNLNVSITLSYSSPCITPGARELLRLLSILPDGLSDAELTQSNLPIGNIQACKSVLIATSLAYKDTKSRLRSLVPIREHIQQFLPPSEALVQAIQKSFHHLLTLFQKHRDTHLGLILTWITANLANLEQVLQRGLHPGSPNLSETIQCVLTLNSFFRMTRSGETQLLQIIPIHICDHRMNISYITQCMTLRRQVDIGQLIAQGISHLQHLHDPILEAARFYAAAGATFLNSQPSSQHLKFLEKALALSSSIGDSKGQYQTLTRMADFKWRIGDFKSSLAISKDGHQLAYQAADFYQVSITMHITALSLTALGDYIGSLTQLTRARELLSLCGITSGHLYHHIMTSQAEIHLQKSEYAKARSIYAMILQDNLLDSSSSLYGFALLNLSLISVLIGATTDTVHHTLDQAQEIFTGVKHQLGIVCCTTILADFNLREGNEASAKTQFQNCLKSAWGTDTEVVSYCLERLADISRWPIELRQATWPVLYLCHAHISKEKLAFYKALLFIGDLFINMDEATAESLFIVALEGFTFMDVHRSRAQCMLRLGDLAQRKGEITKAVELWTSARPLLECSLQAKDVAAIDTRLVALEQDHKTSLAKLTILNAPGTAVNRDEETTTIKVVSSKAYETATIIG